MDETNPDWMNHDQCWDKRTPVSADFDVFTLMRDTVFLELDTLVYPADLLLSAKDRTAEHYYWKIGDNPMVLTGREVNLYFGCDSDMVLSELNVILITERLKDTTCTSEALLRDTLVKSKQL